MKGVSESFVIYTCDGSQAKIECLYEMVLEGYQNYLKVLVKNVQPISLKRLIYTQLINLPDPDYQINPKRYIHYTDGWEDLCNERFNRILNAIEVCIRDSLTLSLTTGDLRFILAWVRHPTSDDTVYESAWY